MSDERATTKPWIVLVARCHECPLLNDEHNLCTHPSVGGSPTTGNGRAIDIEADRPDWCPLPNSSVLIVDGV